jgi:hypothetical protein
MRPVFIAIPCILLAFSACSRFSGKNQPTIYSAGDKATSGGLIYNLIDAERSQQIGDDAATARTAGQRFYLLKVTVSNTTTDDTPIPGMTLVDDSGETYPELADGIGITNWLGVIRKVAPAQTEQGVVLFDAPPKHYRLRLNDPLDDKEIAIDIPLSFVRDTPKILPAASGQSAYTPLPAAPK